MLAKDDPEASLRELFAKADKHMYIQKNHAKRKEAEAERRLSLRLLKMLSRYRKNFANCLYCDLKLDAYRTIRARSDFPLASEGSYSGAVQQLVEEIEGQTGNAYRARFRRRRWRSRSFIGRMRWTFPLRRRRGRNYAVSSSFPWTLTARGIFTMSFLRFSTSAGRRMRLWGRRKRSPSTMSS